jgi:hypothetical protein
MIIGRYSVDPADVVAGSMYFDAETTSYRVVIERVDGCEHAQSVTKEAEAKALLKLIDKAIKEGSGIREERKLAAWGEDDPD